MKKLFMFLAVAGLATLGVSCGGSDDKGGDDPKKSTLVLALETPASEIFAGSPFELSIVDGEGNPINGALLLVDGEDTDIESEDGVFGVSAPGGVYNLSAYHNGVTSNEVKVTVQNLTSEGTGSFTIAGNNYSIEQSYVVLRGLYYKDDTETDVIALWQIESYSGDRTAIVRFTTPATPAAQEGYYNFEDPTATNTTGVLAAVLNGETVEGETNTGVTVNFGATMAEGSSYFVGQYSAAATINSAAFSLTFDGSTPYIESSSRKQAKGTSATITNASKNSKIKATNLSVLKNSL